MAKKRLLLLPLFYMLLQTAAAQTSSSSFAPGRWYVGLKYETQPQAFFTDRYYFPGITLSYNLLPRLALQSGITVVGAYQSNFSPPATQPGNLTGSWVFTDRTSTGAYVPLFLRYLFSKPDRRFQPYGLAGIHTSFYSFESTKANYRDGQFLSQEESGKQNRLTITPSIGAGLRVRVVNRVFLHTEMKVHRHGPLFSPIFLGPVSGQFGIGLQYEFR